ncbi:MAG: hypothetical protein QGF90_01020 [Gammaproteobacteria bacterium]|jgi:hypothetical protein|nr:hypothetical protein [Gammaproteobacteria bacterium]
MNSIDEQIRKALADEDQKAIEEINSQAGLFEIIGLTFRGKQAWMSYYMWGAGLVVFVAGLLFLDSYIYSTDIKESLNYALLILTCLFAITILKIFSFLQMAKLELIREIKRLEMRVLVSNAHNRDNH